MHVIKRLRNAKKRFEREQATNEKNDRYFLASCSLSGPKHSLAHLWGFGDEIAGVGLLLLLRLSRHLDHDLEFTLHSAQPLFVPGHKCSVLLHCSASDGVFAV